MRAGSFLRNAVHNPAPLIQSGSVAQKLIAAFGLKGKSIVPSVGQEVHPVVIVEDLVRQSWFNARSERGCGGGEDFFLPVVAEFANVQLFNPVGSGVAIIVDTIFIQAPTGATNYNITQSSTALTTLLSSVNFNFTDSLHLTGGPAAEVRTQSTAASGGGALVAVALLPVNEMTQINLGGIYGPGTGIAVRSMTATNSIGAAFLWRERYLDPQ